MVHLTPGFVLQKCILGMKSTIWRKSVRESDKGQISEVRSYIWHALEKCPERSRTLIYFLHINCAAREFAKFPARLSRDSVRKLCFLSQVEIHDSFR